MTRYSYRTVDVFTRSRFGGNQLAVFPEATGLDTATMQAIAAEMNFSETAFVEATEHPDAFARVRIFNRQHEMAFAGHPNVGTAYVLAKLGMIDGDVVFDELAGLVEVKLLHEAEEVTGAQINAPRPLELGLPLDRAEVARCLKIDPSSIRISAHPPIQASVGIDFVLVEVTADALRQATPDLNSYRDIAASHPELCGRLSIFPYAAEGTGIRARMFAPLAGTWEDPATGSANAALAALRLSLDGAEQLAYTATQGVEMGRPSSLSMRAWKDGDGFRASVAGPCVDVFSGYIDL